MYAQDEARDLNHAFIGTEHLLLGLIRESDGIAAKTLGAVGVAYDAVRKKVDEISDPKAGSLPGAPPFTPRTKKVLELSLREALQLGHNYIGTEHLLLGLVREGSGVATQILRELGVDLTHVHEKVMEMIAGQRGRELSGTPTPGQSGHAILRGVVRTVGQELRPDLGSSELDDRATKIADVLFEQLRQSWVAPDGPH